jgi:hypothetical protein
VAQFGRHLVVIPGMIASLQGMAESRAHMRERTGTSMNVIRANRPAEDAAPANEVEGEIRGFVRKEFASVRRPQPLVDGGDQGAQQVNSLIQRVAGASVMEIEKLISELQTLRDFLRSEGDRVQREIAGYVQLSDAAMKSTKIIADSVTQWKSAMDSARGDRV